MKKVLLIIITVVLSTSILATGNIANKYNHTNSVSIDDIIKISGNSSGGSSSNNVSSRAYTNALNTAKAEQKKAKKVGFEWNTIRKLIRKAKKYHKSGNDKAAIKKLTTAISHAKLGQMQAIAQKGAGPRY